MKCPQCEKQLPDENPPVMCPACGRKLQPGENAPPRNLGFDGLWIIVGLLPIPILLTLAGSNQPRPGAPIILILCTLCNLVGGIGCLGSMKNLALRTVLGVLLGGVFFVLSWGIALFQACSHMNI
jgi:hypothetical protein